jgi:hypothetical protein
MAQQITAASGFCRVSDSDSGSSGRRQKDIA